MEESLEIPLSLAYCLIAVSVSCQVKSHWNAVACWSRGPKVGESCEVWNGHGCLGENMWKYGYRGEPGSLLGCITGKRDILVSLPTTSP